jgi:hypothetical protein
MTFSETFYFKSESTPTFVHSGSAPGVGRRGRPSRTRALTLALALALPLAFALGKAAAGL